MAATTDDDVRVRAYHLWEADGCPDGRDLEYWQRAKQSLTASGKDAAPPPARRRIRAQGAATPSTKRRKS